MLSSLMFPKISTALPQCTVIPFTAVVLTLPLLKTLSSLAPHWGALPVHSHPAFSFLCSRPGPEGEACVGVTELTGLSGLCLQCWLFPFPLFTAASTAAVYPTVTHTHRYQFTKGGGWSLRTGSRLHRAACTVYALKYNKRKSKQYFITFLQRG